MEYLVTYGNLIRLRMGSWAVSDYDPVIATVRPTDGTPMPIAVDVTRASTEALRVVLARLTP